MKDLEIYCITDKKINLSNKNYRIGWVGKEEPPSNYIQCNKNNNIFHKEKNYSELTFQYWYWKNLLNKNNNHWIGFCQKRRYWIKKESKNLEINNLNFNNHILDQLPAEWSGYDAIICEPIAVNNVNKMKIIKRGFRSLLKDPSIFFDANKQTLLLHFDMHHGYGNIEKAINHLDQKDKNDFFQYLNQSTYYNPHIMFITKSNIMNKWFDNLFSWLSKCEQTFGFENLQGYDTQRLYAYLAERYLSYWFKKYTKYKTWPWITLDKID